MLVGQGHVEDGDSVVDSYRGAHLFDILGLHSTVVDRCFLGTPAPLSGIGFAEIERQLRQTWKAPDEEAQISVDLPDYGWVRFRKADLSEPHAWQPPTVKALQSVVGSARGVAQPTDPAGAFAIYTRDVIARDPAVLRDLLEISPVGPELDLEDVDSSRSLCKKFIASAMSLGSLSPEAHQTITIAMNIVGGRSNTGEGGEDPSVYRLQPVERHAEVVGESGLLAQAGGGAVLAEAAVVAPAVHVSLNNKIKQVASGAFRCDR